MSALTAIWAYVQKSGQVTADQLKFDLGLSEAVVSSTLAHLQQTGRIKPLKARGSTPVTGFEEPEDRHSSDQSPACGGSCSCSNGPLGPSLTVWVKK